MIEKFMQKAKAGETLVYYVGNYANDIGASKLSERQKIKAEQKMSEARFYAMRGLGILTQKVKERTKRGSIYEYRITRVKRVDPELTWW